MTSSPCPDTAALQQLLDGTLPETQQAELAQHLESCASCRIALDRLATEGRSFSAYVFARCLLQLAVVFYNPRLAVPYRSDGWAAQRLVDTIASLKGRVLAPEFACRSEFPNYSSHSAPKLAEGGVHEITVRKSATLSLLPLASFILSFIL